MPCTCSGYTGKKQTDWSTGCRGVICNLVSKGYFSSVPGIFRLRIVSVVLCFDFILEFFKQKFSVFVRLCCLSVQFSWFFPVFVDSVSPIIHITKIDLKTKKKKTRKEKLHRWRVLKHKTKGGAFITSTQFQAEARLFSLRNWALTLSLKYQGLLSLEKEIIQAHR